MFQMKIAPPFQAISKRKQNSGNIIFLEGMRFQGGRERDFRTFYLHLRKEGSIPACSEHGGCFNCLLLFLLFVTKYHYR